MDDVERRVKGHLDAWMIADARERAAALGRVYTDDVTVVEPDRVLRGREVLNERITELHRLFGGLEFTVLGPIERNQDYVLYRWSQPVPGRAEPVTGWDVLTFQGERITHVVMFIPAFEDLEIPEPA
ncbi:MULTISPECIES: nuclear transport factor 2 family protein [unclassified Amycolatopsis]|uniref:nuclear transport factor 2 family protein n=1 Tax=unclassified Amycolatopsis TaxID=2618356 RepID=UPI003455695B